MFDDFKFEWGGYLDINIDLIDLEVFLKIKDVYYFKVIMNKGDCIFMFGGEIYGKCLFFYVRVII